MCNLEVLLNEGEEMKKQAIVRLLLSHLQSLARLDWFTPLDLPTPNHSNQRSETNYEGDINESN